MNPIVEGTPVYIGMVEAFVERFNRENHTLGELKNRWITLLRGNVGIRMKLELFNGRPVEVSSQLYFCKKRRNGAPGIPKFCARNIGAYTGSSPHWFAVRHSRAGKARFAYTNSSDTIRLMFMREM